MRDTLLAFLPHGLRGACTVWNHHCGRGFDAYSLSCILLSAFPGIRLSVWAEDADTRAIILAPDLAVQRDAIPPYLARGDCFVETPEGMQFSGRVRECTQFALADPLPLMDRSSFDLIVARDILSYSERGAQHALLESFEKALKPGGLLILGLNERPWIGEWKSAARAGLRAHWRRE